MIQQSTSLKYEPSSEPLRIFEAPSLSTGGDIADGHGCAPGAYRHHLLGSSASEPGGTGKGLSPENGSSHGLNWAVAIVPNSLDRYRCTRRRLGSLSDAQESVSDV